MDRGEDWWSLSGAKLAAETNSYYFGFLLTGRLANNSIIYANQGLFLFFLMYSLLELWKKDITLKLLARLNSYRWQRSASHSTRKHIFRVQLSASSIKNIWITVVAHLNDRGYTGASCYIYVSQVKLMVPIKCEQRTDTAV